MIKNAVILAGGNGTRLAPLTYVVNKHLLSVSDKFIIDYPIHTLLQMGVENLTVILGGEHFSQIVDHLEDGRFIGMNVNYVYQGEAKGIAHAVNLCQRFVQDDKRFAVILGDNIFSNPIAWEEKDGAQIALARVPDPRRFGVAYRNANGHIFNIVEKPQELIMDADALAITGCYLFTQRYFEFFKILNPSTRGEYEIVDIINLYRLYDNLHSIVYEDFWSDAGTHESVARCNRHFYQHPQNQ